MYNNLKTEDQMTSIKVHLYTYRETRKGTYPLVFQILHNRRKRVIYSPYRLYKECFDESCGLVVSKRRKQVKNAEEINLYIGNMIHKLQQTIDVLEESNKQYTAADVTEMFRSHRNESQVLVYMKKQMLLLGQSRRFGTLNAYTSTYHRIIDFVGVERKLYFSDITSHFLVDFIDYLKKSGIKENTANFYCRILRAVYNKAYREDIAGTQADSPFHKVSFGSVSTVKRAIGSESIKKIIHADVRNNNRLQLAKDIFLFSFYSRGMSFIDMAYLKHRDICNHVIYYRRRKTGHPLRIKMVSQLEELVEKYRSESEYVLPILRCGNKSLYSIYRSKLRNLNNSLKLLGEELKLEIPLTSYVARHSWATLARECGIPVSVISEALGHTSEKVTYTYLNTLNPDILDSCNEKMSLIYV